MLPAALAAVACPHCGQPVDQVGSVIGCAHGHRFDLARQGYVSLLSPRARTDTGDSADMVAARVEFLGQGHYAPIAAAVAAAVGPGAGPILEIGAGTGYYLSAALDGYPGRVGIALDSSKFAARRAAGDGRLLSVVADAWSALPILAGAVGTVLNVFAPRDPAEVTRVLAPAGRLVVVTPEPEHLRELRAPLGLLSVDAGKADRLEASLARLEPVLRQRLDSTLHLSHAAVFALVRMGPTARHVDQATIRTRVASLSEPAEVTTAVTVSVFQKPR